jgi:hypothetical protein
VQATYADGTNHHVQKHFITGLEVEPTFTLEFD